IVVFGAPLSIPVPLPEIKLPVPADVAPITLLLVVDPLTFTSSTPLPASMDAVPVALVPMKFPMIVLFEPITDIPVPLPAITFLEAGVVLPIVLPEDWNIEIPAVLPR